jgi:hypothetical protein
MGRLTQAALTPESELRDELNLSDDDWGLLATVLRNSRDVPGEDQIRGYLRLKLSTDEAALPGYDEFRNSVVLGAYEDVSRFLSTPAASERLDLYGERLVRILEEELRAGRVEGALNVIGITAAIDELNQWITKVVVPAVDDGRLLKRIAPGSARVFAQAVDRLPPDSATRVLGGLAESFIGAEDDAAREGLALALSSALRVVTEETRHAGLDDHRDALRTLIASDEVRDRFALYEPLLREEPQLLSREVADAARDQVIKAEGSERLRNTFIGTDDPATTTTDEQAATLVLLHAARDSELFDAADADSLLLGFASVLSESADDETLFKSVIDYLITLVEAFPTPPDAADSLVDFLASQHLKHPDVLALLAVLPLESRDAQLRELVRQLPAETFIQFVRRHHRVPAPLRAALLDRVAQEEKAGVWSDEAIDEVRAIYDRPRLARDAREDVVSDALRRWAAGDTDGRRRVQEALRKAGGPGTRLAGLRLGQAVGADDSDPHRYGGLLLGAREGEETGDVTIGVEIVATLWRAHDGRVSVEIADIEPATDT